MNARDADWPRLLELFGRLVDAPVDERENALGELVAGEPALHARLVRLLALDASGNDLAAEVSAWRDTLIASDAAKVPARIGAWRIVRELGSGGMGRVHLAERADGAYEQQVALKLIRTDAITPAALARFAAERRILARLDHPGIAALVDGGVDDEGQPWFAMQYVDGRPLPQHCVERNLDAAARVRLMIGVCDAVAYAHRQLVVHCDLKPSNVLVDERSQPRLLDFGIARLLAANDSDASVATQTQARVMTPGYAAPEQLVGETVGVAADVYALGAMLHELLAGRRPYADDGETPAAIALAQARGEPPPMSHGPTRAGGVPAIRLRGDLDLIVATALRHDPERRYLGAAALADDLRRHLDGRPLLAQRDRRGVRLRKFVSRHRVAVPAVALAAIALVATAVYASLQSLDARHQAQRAESVRAFLLGLFEQADPDRGGGRSLSARDLIDAGARRVRHDLGGDPDTRIELLGVVGNLYASLGDSAAAADVHATRLAAAQRQYPTGDPREVRARIDLAQAESERDHFERARELADGALAALGNGGEAMLRADALATLGAIEKRAGRYDAAIDGQRRRIAVLRQTHADGIALAAAYDDLGVAQHALARYDESARNYAEALRLVEAHGDVAPSLLLRIRYDLALAEHENGHYERADALFRRNLELARETYGDAHRSVADQLYQLGQNARQSGREADSLPWLREALAIYERVDGPRHSRVATALTTLGQAQLRTGAGGEAIANLERAYRIYLDTLGPKHLYTAVGETALAQAKLETGDATGAEGSFRDALAKYADANPDHVYAEATRKGLGEALIAQRRFDEAETTLKIAYARVSAKFGAGDPRSVQVVLPLVACLRAQRRDADAVSLLESTRSAIEAGADTPSRARLLEKVRAAQGTAG